MRDEEQYDAPESSRDRRSSGPGWFAVVALSLVTSVVSTVATVVAIAKVPALQPLGHSAASASGAVSAGTTADAGVGSVSVPNLVRVPRDNVQSIVESVGLRLIVNERQEQSDVPAGLVAAQAPRAGTSVARGSDLVVVISSGPAPVDNDAGVASAPTPIATPTADDAGATPADSVAVPSVYRLYVREARSRLTLSGLSLGEERRGGYDEDMSPGRILRQSPTAGTRVSRGTVVHVWVNQE